VLILLCGGRDERSGPAPTPSGWMIAATIIAVVIIARIGRSLIFHGYSASRDEVMVELAGAYFADGRIGWPVPPEWLPYARAMMPEFISPYGADSVWTSIYLPVHAAIRALFTLLGDADLAAPVTLGAGLVALWSVARRLFPDRFDVQCVVLVMAASSTQLLATAMTPYAMTSHFALDMVWLALILRGGWRASAAAAVVLILAAGLHQWHFPILFVGPFIVWMLWRRDWVPAAIQLGATGVAILLWARGWPMLLEHVLGPAVGGPAQAAPEVHAKVASLFARLDKWQPLLNISRLIGWNNVLLLPLGALSLALLPRSRRGWWREPPIVLPLLGTVLLGFAFALYQGYGWGFRYMHGQIGALCLLAGFGWSVLSREGRRPLTLIWAGTAISLIAMAWLLSGTERHVRGYARTMDAIRESHADVVLVDLRGGYFMTDLVRFADGRPGRPAVMALGWLGPEQLRNLCASHDVAILDYRQFWRLGVHPVNPLVREGVWLDRLRDELDSLGCGRPVIPSTR